MIAKIGVVICVLAVFINFGVEPARLFVFSVIATIVTISFGLVGSYLATGPDINRYTQKVEQMKLDGATDAEILEFIECSSVGSEGERTKLVPSWLYLLMLLSIIAGAVLLIAGLGIRF